jgi:hypothetical protein
MMQMERSTTGTPGAADAVPVARMHSSRADGGFATYRDFGVRDWLRGTEPVYSGDHGKLVRTGSTPRVQLPATAAIVSVAGSEREVSGALGDAIDAARLLAHQSRPDNDHVTPPIGLVHRTDAPDAWRVQVGLIDPQAASRTDSMSNLFFVVSANRIGGPTSARVEFEPIDRELAAIVAGSTPREAIVRTF